MNNVKVIYYNAETIDRVALESSIMSNSHCVSHLVIKTGLMLVNYRGSARDLFNAIELITGTNSILIHDLDPDGASYWGIMNKNVWDWLRDNRS